MVCQRLLCPGSKLETTRLLGQSTLASELGVEGAAEDELYAAIDWLGERQQRIEDRLAARHLEGATLVLYDLSSSYFEGRHCPLAALGYSRDGKRGTCDCSGGGDPGVAGGECGEGVDYGAVVFAGGAEVGA